MISGYILLHRQIVQWEWYTNPNTFRLFIHCLLMANYIDGFFEGREIKRGQFVTSIDHLSKETRLTNKEVRTALDRLQRTGELASESCNRYRVITVVKYDQYQIEGKQNGRQRASQGQAEGKPGASQGQQYNKDNKERNIVDDDSNIFYLSSAEASEYIRQDQEIEAEALNVGLTVSPSSIQKARDLSFRYGHSKVLEAIRKAVDVPKWSYVEGILRNMPTEEDTKTALQRSADRVRQSMIARGEWDTEYDCAKDIADEYRAKGISPEEAKA